MNGFSLIEVMVSLLLLSIGLLAIAGMQITGVKYTHEAYLRSVAATQLSNMMERLRANRSSTLRGRDFMRWNAINAQILPEGEGRYFCQDNHCTVHISWTLGSIQGNAVLPLLK